LRHGTTHEVLVDLSSRTVTKRFRSWERGEPVREWTALTLLAEFAPGLAPVPVSVDLSSNPPVLVMSWLPGTGLGTGPVTPAQACALAGALERLWQSVPCVEREFAPAAGAGPLSFAAQVRQVVAAGMPLGGDPVVERAYAAGVAWLGRGVLEGRALAGPRAVFGHGDPNLANYLWDQGQVRLVDFEDSGPSDRSFELALLTEHLSAWSDGQLDAGDFLALFDLTSAESARVRDYRRLAALFWLIMLRPGGPSGRRNPPGTLQCQARRLLGLLG
jgi:Phosphotransferase enzyme family